MEQSQHYTYVLYSPKFDKIYIGYAENPANRFIAHNHPQNKGYTKRYAPWIMVKIEKFDCQIDAIKREKQLKSHKGRDFIRKLIQDIWQI